MNRTTKKVIMITCFILGLLWIIGFVGIRFWGWFPLVRWTQHGHMMGGLMPLLIIGLALFWLVVIYLAINLFGEKRFANSDDLKTKLKRRLVNGEITPEQYEELLVKINKND